MKAVHIYFDAEKKCVQVVRPTNKFDGKVADLVHHITGGKFHSYEYI